MSGMALAWHARGLMVALGGVGHNHPHGERLHERLWVRAIDASAQTVITVIVHWYVQFTLARSDAHRVCSFFARRVYICEPLYSRTRVVPLTLGRTQVGDGNWLLTGLIVSPAAHERSVP